MNWLLIVRLILLLLPSVGFAEPSGLGEVANNLLEPVSILSDFVGSASIIIGASFVFASFIRYMQHRVNPLAFPISTIVILFILGVLLMLVPMAYKLAADVTP